MAASTSADELVRELPRLIATRAGAAGVELLRFGLRSRWVVTERYGVRSDIHAGALAAELWRSITDPPRGGRRLSSEAGHAALFSARLGLERVSILVVPPPGRVFDRSTLSATAILVAHASAVLERLVVRRSMLEETACRVATLGLIADAVVMLNPQGVVRACSPAAADLLDVHRDAIVGHSLRDIPDASEMAVKLSQPCGLDDVVVAFGSGEVVLNARSFPAGVVARIDPVTPQPSQPAFRSDAAPAFAEALVGMDPQMVTARRTARHAAADGRCIVIIGEPGTGRRTLAEAIHCASRSAGDPLLTVDVSRQLAAAVETELFGDDRDGSAPGKVAQASGGSLLVVGAERLSAAAQRRLAPAGRPDGGNRADRQRASVLLLLVMERVPSAGALGELVTTEAALRIHLPPLRQRAQDIGPVARYLMECAAVHLSRSPLAIAAHVIADLERYRWPGNVRELAELIEAWLSLLPLEVTEVQRTPAHIRRALASVSG